MEIIVTPASAGPVHSVFTVTGTFTAGFNSTMQVRVTVDPMGWIGLDGLGTIVTDEGVGTIIVYMCKEDVFDGYVDHAPACNNCVIKPILLFMVIFSASVNTVLVIVTLQLYFPASDSLRGEKERVSDVSPWRIDPFFLHW